MAEPCVGTSEMTMVERVARAIFGRMVFENPHITFEPAFEHDDEMWKAVAVDVMETMREPTQAMTGIETYRSMHMSGDFNVVATPAACYGIWKAMIDVELSRAPRDRKTP